MAAVVGFKFSARSRKILTFKCINISSDYGCYVRQPLERFLTSKKNIWFTSIRSSYLEIFPLEFISVRQSHIFRLRARFLSLFQMLLDYANNTQEGLEFLNLLSDDTTYKTLFVPLNTGFSDNTVRST